MLTSGYRLVLNYNLVYTNGTPFPRAETVLERKRFIPLALRALRRSELEADAGLKWPLAYMLKCKYDAQNLGLEHLRGIDHIRAQILQQDCQKEGFSLCSAHIERTVLGGCEEAYSYDRYDRYSGGYDDDDNAHHDTLEETDSTLELTNIVLPNGTVCAQGVKFGMEDILQPDWYEDKNPDEEDYDRMNDPPTTTHYFRNHCLLIIPESKCEDFVFDATANSVEQARDLLNALMRRFEEAKRRGVRLKVDPSLEPSRNRLSKFCYRVLDRFTWFGDQLFSAVLLLDNPSLMHSIACIHEIYLFPQHIFSMIGQALPFELSNPTQWKEATAVAAQKSKKLNTIWVALSAVIEGFKKSLMQKAAVPDSTSLKSIQTWAFSVLADSLKVLQTFDEEDAETLVRMSQEHPDGEKFLFGTMLPFAKMHVMNESFTFSVLRTLYICHEEGTIRKEVATNIYQDIFDNLLEGLLRSVNNGPDQASKKPRYGSSYSHPDPWSIPVPGRDHPRPEHLSALCCQCLALGLEREVCTILDALAQKSIQCDLQMFSSLYTPSLRTLIGKIASLEEHTWSQYRQSVQTIIDDYVRRYLGKNPVKKDMYIMERCGCGHYCDPCKRLDDFLTDSRWRLARFAYNESIRKHLLSRLDYRLRTSIDHNSGMPYVLVVEKLSCAERLEMEMTDYNHKKKQVSESLWLIDLESLSKVLGISPAAIVDFDSPRNTEVVEGHPRLPLANIPLSATPNLASKPSIQIVDLTGEMHSPGKTKLAQLALN